MIIFQDHKKKFLEILNLTKSDSEDHTLNHYIVLYKNILYLKDQLFSKTVVLSLKCYQKIQCERQNDLKCPGLWGWAKSSVEFQISVSTKGKS